MALTTSTRSFIGKGKIYAGLRSGGAAFPIGNVASLSLAITEEKKELLDYTSAGGGTKDTLSRISGIEGTMNAHDFSPENLALVLRGEVDTEVTGSVAAEAHTAYTNGFLGLTYLPDTGATITPVIAVSDTWTLTTAYVAGDCILANSDVFQCTTAGTSSGTEPTWTGEADIGDTIADGTVTWTNRGAVAMVDGTDYEVGKAGIFILSTATRFTAGLPITVAYTKNAAEVVQSLVSSSLEYTLYFDGLNEVDSGNPYYVKIHRIKFGVTAGLDMIGDEFGALEVKFDVLQDTTISGTGISQYLKIAQVAG